MPFWDGEVLAEGFDVGDEVPGCVVSHGGVGAGFPAAALVEEDDAVGGGGEESGVAFGAVAAGAAVEEDGWVGGLEGVKGWVESVLARLSVFLSVLLVEDLVDFVDLEPSLVPRIVVFMTGDCWYVSHVLRQFVRTDLFNL